MYQHSVNRKEKAHHWPQVTAHDRVAQEFIAMIPPDAALSAQANLYPPVALRRKTYLFPAVEDAEYVLLDVISPTYPIDVPGLRGEVIGLLDVGGFGVLRTQDGYLLLKRGLPPGWAQLENAAFLSFARGAVPPGAHRTSFCSEMPWSLSATNMTSTTR